MNSEIAPLPKEMALSIRPSTTKNTNHDTQYSLRVIRPEKEKGALNIEKQGLTLKPAYYNPSHRIIRSRASFLIDNMRFLRDFSAMRKALGILLLSPVPHSVGGPSSHLRSPLSLI
jgi:hypothetical protein